VNSEKLNSGGSISNWDKDIKNVLIHHISMRSEINSSKQRKVRHDKLFCILRELPQAFPGKVFGPNTSLFIVLERCLDTFQCNICNYKKVFYIIKELFRTRKLLLHYAVF